MKGRVEFYFDIETLGIDPSLKKIITIQWCPLEPKTGKPRGELSILQEWESSEANILRRCLDKLKPDSAYPDFAFVPVGDNLRFDFWFLRERWNRVLGVDIPYERLFYNKPHVCTKSILIISNEGLFKGHGLSDRLGLERENVKVPDWYARGEYDQIIDYVRREAETFFRHYEMLKREIPQIPLS